MIQQQTEKSTRRVMDETSRPQTDRSPTLIRAQWPLGDRVDAGSTTRRGGISQAPFDQLNLGLAAGDEAVAVLENRRRLQSWLRPAEPIRWLHQQHTTTVCHVDELTDAPCDAVWVDRPGVACVVISADCLPVLLADEDATVVAAVHGGWRGLQAGILDRVIDTLGVPAHRLHAWLGPAIGPASFEVRDDVRQAFAELDPACLEAFRDSDDEHFMADLYRIASIRLRARGVTAISGGLWDTHADPARFFSYRRDGQTGRQAAWIMLRR